MAESQAGPDGGRESESSGAAKSQSFSMRTTVYGIKKKFPSVQNISCQELKQWRGENRKLICLVNPDSTNLT